MYTTSISTNVNDKCDLWRGNPLTTGVLNSVDYTEFSTLDASSGIHSIDCRKHQSLLNIDKDSPLLIVMYILIWIRYVMDIYSNMNLI